MSCLMLPWNGWANDPWSEDHSLPDVHNVEFSTHILQGGQMSQVMGFPRETSHGIFHGWFHGIPKTPRTPHLVIGSRSNLKPPTDEVLILLQRFIFLFELTRLPSFSLAIQYPIFLSRYFCFHKITFFSRKITLFVSIFYGTRMDLQERWSKSSDLMTQVPSWWYHGDMIYNMNTRMYSIFVHILYIYIWYDMIWYGMVWYDMIWIYIYIYIYISVFMTDYMTCCFVGWWLQRGHI